jgi:Putative auto-transporter adhesin, head GIN domain
MRRSFFYIVFCVLTISLFFACNRRVKGSGNIITQTRQIANFTGIASSASIDVAVTIANEFKVEVEADDNVVALIRTQVVNDVLEVGFVNNTSIRNTNVKVYITVPSLNYLKASSSSGINVSGIIKNNKVSFYASSSATINAEVDAPFVETTASSSAEMEIAGTTKNHNAEASSSAEINTTNLLAEEVTATASSSATIFVHSSLALNAKASSSANIYYRGNAKVKQSTSSSGEVGVIN